MPCYHPISLALPRKNDPLVTDQQTLPCGNCLGCRSEQARQWAVRMMHETHVHDSNLFVTLTYDEKEIPENGSLCPKHLSKFVKDLRKKGQEFSYYGCGEYGERTHRPHYHVCLFGARFSDARSGLDFSRPSIRWSESLEDIWGRGKTEFGTVTMASASYVAGYVRKKVAEAGVPVNMKTGELLEKEFARMSLNPAIGRDWIAVYWRDVYPRDYVVVDGQECKPPRYYDKYMAFDIIDIG